MAEVFLIKFEEKLKIKFDLPTLFFSGDETGNTYMYFFWPNSFRLTAVSTPTSIPFTSQAFVWNSLPAEVITAHSLDVFKARIGVIVL